jgi:tRNA(His) 5'-end guanylyltransferase
MRLAQLNRSFDQRVAEAVAQRCAPLVEQVERAMVLIQTGFDEEAWNLLAAASAAYHAAQDAGRGT